MHPPAEATPSASTATRPPFRPPPPAPPCPRRRRPPPAPARPPAPPSATFRSSSTSLSRVQPSLRERTREAATPMPAVGCAGLLRREPEGEGGAAQLRVAHGEVAAQQPRHPPAGRV